MLNIVAVAEHIGKGIDTAILVNRWCFHMHYFGQGRKNVTEKIKNEKVILLLWDLQLSPFVRLIFLGDITLSLY